MRLTAFLAEDGPAVGVATPDGSVIRLRSVEGGLDLALADAGLPELLTEARGILGGGDDASFERYDRGELQLLPAVEFPGKVVCVGLNYAEHIREGGREAPERPVLFGKWPNAIIGDGEAIVRPEGTAALDLEAELGVVIGRRARRVTAAQAMDHVAGYVVVNDVSARDWQGVPAALQAGAKGDGQWLRAKGSDTFLPVGSDFVTADEVDPVAGLRIRSWRIPGSGDDAGTAILMQDSSTATMIRNVAELLELITQQITLEPGDLVATGTPAGVGVYREPPVFLVPGDRVRCQVDGVGSVENPVIDWSEVSEAG